MTGISASTLTGAGFSAGTAGGGASGGTPYMQSFGSIAVTVTLFGEPEPGGQDSTYSGVLTVVPGAATSEQFADLLTALSAIGFGSFAATLQNNTSVTAPQVSNPGAENVRLTTVGGLSSFSMSF